MNQLTCYQIYPAAHISAACFNCCLAWWNSRYVFRLGRGMHPADHLREHVYAPEVSQLLDVEVVILSLLDAIIQEVVTRGIFVVFRDPRFR